MNFQPIHALCICFSGKPEHEQAFIFFQQNFMTLCLAVHYFQVTCDPFLAPSPFPEPGSELAGQAQVRQEPVQRSGPPPSSVGTALGFLWSTWGCSLLMERGIDRM